MIIKNIAKLCKRAGVVVLWNDEERGVQWTSNGAAAWQMAGMPWMDAETVLTALDVPEKDRDKIVVREIPAPGSYDLDDESEEIALRDPAIMISYGGQQVLPVTTPEGVLLVNPDLFRPLKDVSQLTVHFRRSESGTVYLALKRGLLLQGIILPLRLGQFAGLPEILRSMAEKLEASIQAEQESAQMAIDPETGEIL